MLCGSEKQPPEVHTTSGGFLEHSLGERMKCELVASLLHRPKVIFLNEPTLGRDISMQSRLRRLMLDYNQRHGATVILTSHYMADVVALCPRRIPLCRSACMSVKR